VAAPASPYCTPRQVALLFPQIVKDREDFADGITKPGRTLVEQYINWISAQIDRSFMGAGWKVPFLALSGESWLVSQTNYLQILAVTGVTGMISTPQVANPTRKGDKRGVFKQEYDKEILSIWEPMKRRTSIRFRAQYYNDTPAEAMLVTAAGPTSDYMEGKYDPTRHESLAEMTRKTQDMQKVFEYLDVPWDYLYSLFDTGVGAWAT